MASIQNRGKSQWQAIVRKKGYRTQCKTFERKRDAEDWAKLVETQMRQCVFADTKAAEETTLGEALKRYAETVTPRKKSADNELNRIKRLLRHELSLRPLASLTPRDFEQYRDLKLKTCCNDTVRLDLALFSNLFSVAKSRWDIELRPLIIRGMKPKPSSGRCRRLSKSEEQTLFSILRSQDDDALTFCVQLAIETGMRCGEIVSLKWEDVHISEHFILLQGANTKNAEDRVVPLSETAEQLLLERRRRYPKLVEKSQRVVRYETSNAIGKAFSTVCKKAKISNFRFHDLRHEAASRLAPHMPAGTLAKIMGWKTIQMAMRYYNPTSSELVNAIRRCTAVQHIPSNHRPAFSLVQ